MAVPTIAHTLGVSPPVFLRKLDRKRDWGVETDPLDARLAAVVQRVFLEDQFFPNISFYLVQSDDDLRRVALAFNGNRDSLTEILDLVAFLPAEFQAAGLVPHRTPGNTLCHFANLTHHDLPDTTTAQELEALCRQAMTAGRIAARCTGGMMKDVVKLAEAEQCLVAVNPSPGCLVPACATPAPVTPPASSSSPSS